MNYLLPVSLWCCASTCDAEGKGSGFEYHFLPFLNINSVEFYRKNSISRFLQFSDTEIPLFSFDYFDHSQYGSLGK